MNIKIFRANRGEGKTKWLVNHAIEAYEAGYELVYLGGDVSRMHFANMWRSEMHEPFPAKPVYEVMLNKKSDGHKYCLLTDDLIENIGIATSLANNLNSNEHMWFITMGAEDFVN